MALTLISSDYNDISRTNISYAGDLYYSFEGTEFYWTSTDSLAWQKHNLPPELAEVPILGFQIIFSNVSKLGDIWLVLIQLGEEAEVTHTMTSSDGINWVFHLDAIPVGLYNSFRGVVNNGSVFCALERLTQFAFVNGIPWISSDGVIWIEGIEFSPVGYTTLTSQVPVILYTETEALFVVLLNDGLSNDNYCSVSPDGLTWTPGSVMPPNDWYSMASNGTVLIFSHNQSVLSTFDTITWTEDTTAIDWAGYGSSKIIWDNTKFVVMAEMQLSGDFTTYYTLATSPSGISDWTVFPELINYNITGSSYYLIPGATGASILTFEKNYITFEDLEIVDRKPLKVQAGQTERFILGDTVPIAQGGTGGITAYEARKNLLLQYDVDVIKYRDWVPYLDQNLPTYFENGYPQFGSFMWNNGSMSSNVGNNTFTFSYNAEAYADYSWAIGYGKTDLYGAYVYSPLEIYYGAKFQYMRLVLGARSYAESPQQLFLDGSFGSRQAVLNTNAVWRFSGKVVATVGLFTDNVNDTATWDFSGTVTRGVDVSDINEVHTINRTSHTAGSVDWTVEIGVDTGTGALTFFGAGDPLQGDISWICHLDGICGEGSEGEAAQELILDSGGGGGGSVTSVGISGSEGISVSGSPITSSGVIDIGLGDITPSSVSSIGTISTTDQFIGNISAHPGSDLILSFDDTFSAVFTTGASAASVITTTEGQDLVIDPVAGGGGNLVLMYIKWPTADGLPGQVLATDGIGTAFWGDAGTVTSVGISTTGPNAGSLTVDETPITSSGVILVSPNTFTDEIPGVVPASGGGTDNFLRADGSWSPASGGGGGSVTSVGISGANGISVAGSPITSSGVIDLGLGNITPTNVASSSDTLSVNSFAYHAANTTGPSISLIKTRAPGVTNVTPPIANDSIGNILFSGGSGSGIANSSSIVGTATETWSGTAKGSKLTFSTVGNGTNVVNTVLTLDQSKVATFTGDVTVGVNQTLPISDDEVGSILFGRATVTETLIGAAIIGNATEDWSVSAQGSRLSFYTTTNGTTATAQVLVLDQNKNSTFAGTVTATGFVGPVTGSVTGNATTATTLQTTRTFSATGDATATAQNFNGSANVALPMVLATVNSSPQTDAFRKITVNAKGLVTATSAVTAADITPLVNSTYVRKIGDTMTGELILSADPSQALGAATKQYVDNLASGLSVKDAVITATTATLASSSAGTITYNNGTAGVGATLTTTGTFNTIGGATVINGDRVMVKDEVAAANNGIYVRTSATVLTRASDFDNNPNGEITNGAFAYVSSGSLIGTQWALTTIPPVTIGTTALNFTQLSGSSAYTAGVGIDISSNVISNTGVRSLAGTTNQIVVSSSTGLVTVSLPSAVTISGIMTASSFSGAGTGLTGTAASLNIGGTAATLTTTRTFSATGDATATAQNFNGSANVALPMVLATVNSNTGSFGSATTVPIITVNAKGLITAVSTAIISSTASLATNLAGGTTGALPYQSALNTTAFLAAGTANQVLIGGASSPVWASTLTGLTSISATAFTGALTGNASTATTLQTARLINGVSFNGSADITLTANTTNALTLNNSGTGAASGSTFNGGAAVTLSYNTIGASPLAGSSSLITTGTITSGTWNGTIIAGQYGGTGIANTGKTITIGGNLTTTGAFTTNLTVTANTAITLPTTGTIYSGSAAPVVGGVIYGSSATQYGSTLVGTANQVLTSNAAAAPTWSTLDLTYLPDSWVKTSVKAASTAVQPITARTASTLTIGGTALTYDSIVLANGDRVLVKNSTSGTGAGLQDNGIYVVSGVGTSVVFTRSSDADSASELGGSMVNIDLGTVNGGQAYTTDFKTTGTVGTTAMNWYQVFTSFDASSTNTANKLVLRDASGNFSAGTITAASFVGPVTGNVTGSSSLNVLKTGDTMTGALTATSFVGPLTGNASTATALATGRTLSLTGDATGTSAAFTGAANASIPMTLATVNSAPQTDTFRKITVNAKGLVTATSVVTAADITPLIDASYVLKAGDTMTGDLTVNTRIGIGAASLASQLLRINGNMAGGTISTAVANSSTIQSGVTGTASGYQSTMTTAAAAFNVTSLVHFYATPAAFGAGSTVTSQFGFYAQSSLTEATNNYGFFGNIGAATGRWNLFMSGSAANYIAGNLYLGITTPDTFSIAGSSVISGVQNSSTALAGASIASIRYNNSNGYGTIVLGKSRGTTAPSQGIVLNNDALGIVSFNGSDGVKMCEAANIIGVVNGAPAVDSVPGAISFRTTNVGATTPTEKMIIGADGTVGIGIITSPSQTLRVGKAITGNTTSFAIVSNGSVSSDVTVAATGIYSGITTSAATFTLSSLYHYQAQPPAFGAGSVVTNQYGYYVSTALTGATNNYGFHGNIAAGTNRWNLYMAGTASNYLEGVLTVNNVVNIFTGTGTNSGTAALIINNGASNGLAFTPKATASAWNALTLAGDAVITAQSGVIDGTGGLVIGPWSSTAKGMRVDANGGVSFGTTLLANVGGIRTAGTAAIGDTVYAGYGIGAAAATIEIGEVRTLAGDAFIDFHSSVGSDFDLRIIKSSGVNGAATIVNVGTGNFNIQTGNGPILFFTNSAERMRLDSSGRLGVGVTPSSWGSVYKPIDIAGYGGIYGSSAASGIANSYGQSGIYQNTYFDGTSSKSLGVGAASQVLLSGGVILFSSAPSVAAGATQTFTEKMRIDPTGNVGIGNTAPTQTLHMGDNTKSQVTGLANASPTGLARWFAGAGPTMGIVIQANGTGISEYGTPAGAVGLAATSGPLTLAAGNAERVRIDTTGDVAFSGQSLISSPLAKAGTGTLVTRVKISLGLGGGLCLVTGYDQAGISNSFLFLLAVRVTGGAAPDVTGTLISSTGSTAGITIAFSNSGGFVALTFSGATFNQAYVSFLGHFST